MRFWLYMVIALLAICGAIFELGCDCGFKTPSGGKIQPWKGVRYTAPKPYQGEAGRTAPYPEDVKPEMGRVSSGGCTSAGCSYRVLARILLHNPTDNTYKCQVGYSWHMGDYEAAKNSMKDVPLPPHSTVAVELQQQVTATESGIQSISGRHEVGFISQ